jgi:ectoine hydroxylase-related dioxygenase (phytanoyl-CoA dioxygenase family)
MWGSAIDNLGFAIIHEVLTDKDVSELREALSQSVLPRSRAGLRHALGDSKVAAIARDTRLHSIATDILGSSALPFRATFFDKSPESNWLVVWHQDTALPLRERREVQGWGPWSMKGGVNYAHAPASALCRVIALRVHLDDSTAENGPLRVLPSTHTHGVLSDEKIHSLAEEEPAVECLVPRGGVLAMRPLIVHASSKSQVPAQRRVLHIEYAAAFKLEDGLELAVD